MATFSKSFCKYGTQEHWNDPLRMIDFLWVSLPEAAVLVRKGKVGVLDEAVHEANQFAHDGD
jgi:hypothetical protein